MRDILENSSFRFKPSSAYTFFEQNFHVAKTFVKDCFTSSTPERLEGRRIALGQGGIFAVDQDAEESAIQPDIRPYLGCTTSEEINTLSAFFFSGY